MIEGSIEVGGEYWKGTIRYRVVRVQEHAGTSKIWVRRSDGANVTHGQAETWEYEGEFRLKFRPVTSAVASEVN